MKTRRLKGFTFIEVIIALIVVSISLLGLIRLHLISISMVEAAEVTSQAVLLAQEKIAETLALGYPEVGISTGQIERNNRILNWRTEVEDLKSPELNEAKIGGLRNISVEVNFGQGTDVKSLQMSTYVADRRLQ
ncbi:MAG: prepilin-type N-terminal cleavage/methylation domain-containing protein [Sedimentisphaerales bacterium]|nr:prepilin-type N-terminal cleavage/methylation domain-containing protein [Sedimentisphaerales bacterium]